MRKIGICFLSLLFANQVLAQEKWTSGSEGELENSEVVIEKNRKIELPNAQRNFLKVPQLKPSTDSVSVNFKWTEVTPQLRSVDPNLRVLRIKDDVLEKLFANQVSAGLGNYGATYLSAYLANKRDKHKSYGLQLYHKHYNKGSIDERYSASGYQLIKPYFKLIKKDFVLSADMAYERSTNYAYGLYEADQNGLESFERSDYQKLYQNVAANIALKDRNMDDKITYEASLSANHLFTTFDTKESVLMYNIDNEYSLNDKVSFGMPVNGFLSQYEYLLGVTQQKNRYLYRLQPNLSYVLDQVTLRAGLNIVGENDEYVNMGKLHVYPRIEAVYKPIANLALKAGINGDVEQKLYQDLINENPYLDNSYITSALKPFKFFMGLNSNLFNRLYVTSDLSVATVQNQHFYANFINGGSGPDAYQTDTYFVSENLTETTAGFALQLTINKFLEFNGSGRYLTYSRDSIENFPNTPKFRYQFGTDINIQDKLEIGLNAYGQSQSVGYEFTNPSLSSVREIAERNINPFIDLGIEVKYHFTSRATAFIDTKNLIAKEYKTYANYPGRGFQVMAGFTYSF